MRELSVLLVDDHPGFIAAAVRHLRRLPWLKIAGFAGNGVEAIAQCEALRPDAVLMDLAMPEMGGLQAARLIKAQDNPPYIVIASHFDDGEHREHALRAGADAFVSKLAYVHEVVPLLEALAAAGDTPPPAAPVAAHGPEQEAQA
ncbi:MAG TPA: response regulator transcription factor [Luteimonas sp.]|nr:response regulator transcription factor [Luteimonas sp.]